MRFKAVKLINNISLLFKQAQSSNFGKKKKKYTVLLLLFIVDRTGEMAQRRWIQVDLRYLSQSGCRIQRGFVRCKKQHAELNYKNTGSQLGHNGGCKM